MNIRPLARIFSTTIALYFRDNRLAVLFRDAGGGVVCKEMELPEGIVVSGMIAEPERFIEAFNELTGAGSGSGSDRNVHDILFAAPDAFSYTHIFSIRNVVKGDLTARVEKEASDLLPIRLEELTSDWLELPNQVKDPTITVFFCAIRKDFFSEFCSMIGSSGNIVALAEVESMSLGRALIHDHVAVTAIVDIDAHVTNVSIFDDSSFVPKVSLAIPVGNADFRSALASRLNVTAVEAESKKQDEGFDTAKGDGSTIFILQERVQIILHDIEKAFAYYEQSTHKKIDRVVLSGEGALIPRIGSYIEANLKRPVALGDPLKDLPFLVTVPNGVSPLLFATLIGLYLRGSSRVKTHGMINLVRGWHSEETSRGAIEKALYWRNIALATFTLSILLSIALLYQALVAPVRRYDAERAVRTSPLAPFEIEELPAAEDDIATTSPEALEIPGGL